MWISGRCALDFKVDEFLDTLEEDCIRRTRVAVSDVAQDRGWIVAVHDGGDIRRSVGVARMTDDDFRYASELP